MLNHWDTVSFCIPLGDQPRCSSSALPIGSYFLDLLSMILYLRNIVISLSWGSSVTLQLLFSNDYRSVSCCFVACCQWMSMSSYKRFVLDVVGSICCEIIVRDTRIYQCLSASALVTHVSCITVLV